jgi:hypothetical protein
MKIKPDFIDIFKGSYLAGGAILSMATKTNISDYDIYPKSNEALLDILSYLMDDSDFFIVNITDKAITFKINSFINDKDGTTIESFKERITGRYTNTKVLNPETKEVVAERNTYINEQLAEKICKLGIGKNSLRQ